MSILLKRETRVIVQGITSEYASRQTLGMLNYGTRVVAGVTPGRGGKVVHGVPVYDSVAEAVAEHPADATAIYVGMEKLRDALVEAVDGGFKLAFVTADGLPVRETLMLRALTREHGVWMVGPNSVGMISPGEAVLGSFSPEWAQPGRIGLFSRGGTLSLYTARVLSAVGFGQSTAIHIGGEAVLGRNPVEYLKAFDADPDTDAVVMLSEVGGGKEHEAAEYIPKMSKPVVALIVGSSVPPGRTMGHAGAIIGMAEHTVEGKRERLAAAGARVAARPEDIPALLRSALKKG
jgi:succinyl-CoA synthetase alpha subunit